MVSAVSIETTRDVLVVVKFAVHIQHEVCSQQKRLYSHRTVREPLWEVRKKARNVLCVVTVGGRKQIGHSVWNRDTYSAKS